MKDILKNWKTSLVGLLILGYAGYRVVILKEALDLQEILLALTGAGFIFGKDGTVSHTKN